MPRSIGFLGVVILAGQVSWANALDFFEARHLLARTGFGSATPAEIEAYLPLTREQAVKKLLDECSGTAAIQPPEWCSVSVGQDLQQRDDEWQAWQKLPREARDKKGNERQQLDRKRGQDLKAWWYRVMLTTRSPLTEHMVLFWHNHFTSGLETVGNPRLMYEQNALLRKHATGNFGHFMLSIPLDPAMFRYLDGDSNVAGRPNENFAREVMELFTVGEGHYSETDIKEAARAFTGYQIDYGTGQAKLNETKHDYGRKNVLGHKGVFDSDEIIKVLLMQEKNVALNIAAKLWREFVSETPDDKAIYNIAKAFYQARYDIKTALKTLLLTEQFWDPAGYGNLTKSPVELLVGAVRTLELDKVGAATLVDMGRKLGQDILDPPNVKGWKGGGAWISTQSLISRWEVLDELRNGPTHAKKRKDGAMNGDPMQASDDPADDSEGFAANGPSWIAKAREGGYAGLELAARVLLPIPAGFDFDSNSRFDDVFKQLVADPAYNLK